MIIHLLQILLISVPRGINFRGRKFIVSQYLVGCDRVKGVLSCDIKESHGSVDKGNIKGFIFQSNITQLQRRGALNYPWVTPLIFLFIHSFVAHFLFSILTLYLIQNVYTWMNKMDSTYDNALYSI